MYNRIILVCLLFGFIVVSSCTATEKIGDYNYKIKTKRVNTGDYGGMIVTIKSYYLKNELQAGCIVKSQLLYHEKETDTVFSSGFTTIDHVTNELKCYEFYYYWYHLDQREKSRDNYRSFIQAKDGKLKLNEIKTIHMVNEKLPGSK
ncbi:hypothetical protein [Paracoccus sp. (in: a-proteobacteria)]|uniref:hypothetical protein n=1 Tax=Paracoccus sp. TaxID=267 RepID=UPI002AFE3460|nr:hypothetical protein [Paracoccus sp. (in: a-proteobacteria)]